MEDVAAQVLELFFEYADALPEARQFPGILAHRVFPVTEVRPQALDLTGEMCQLCPDGGERVRLVFGHRSEPLAEVGGFAELLPLLGGGGLPADVVLVGGGAAVSSGSRHRERLDRRAVGGDARVGFRRLLQVVGGNTVLQREPQEELAIPVLRRLEGGVAKEFPCSAEPLRLLRGPSAGDLDEGSEQVFIVEFAALGTGPLDEVTDAVNGFLGK